MKNSFMILILLPLILFGGCAVGAPKRAKTETKMHYLFENDFEGFVPPQVNKIKGGCSRIFPYTEFDDVWDSAIIVSMQECVIIHSSKESGIIIGIGNLPVSVFVERSEPIKVYVNDNDTLYKTVDSPEKAIYIFKPDTLGTVLESFLDKLSTQIYADEKWKYLYTEKGV